MIVTPHGSRWRRRCSNSSGKDESSATTLIGSPCMGDRTAPTASLLPMWPTARISPPPFGDALPAAAGHHRIDPGRDELRHLGLRHGRQAHQLHEVAAVLPVRAQGQPTHPRMVRRQPEDVPEVPVRPAALGRPERGTTACENRPTISPVGPGGQDVAATGWPPVADDGQTLDDAGAAAPRRCGASRRRSRGGAPRARASCGGRRSPAVTTRRSPPWPWSPASLRSLRLTGASVPTSVSLSSPRMNASTRLKAMSSWICWGGLFMK